MSQEKHKVEENKIPLDMGPESPSNKWEFITNVEDTTKENDKVTPEYSFLSLYKLVPEIDQFLLRLGLLCTIATGIMQPLNAVFYGGLTRTIIDYATVIQNPNTTQEKIHKVTDKFIDGIHYFAVMNFMLGMGVLALTFISIETFTCSATRQIFTIRSSYFSRLLNQDIAWYDLNQNEDFVGRISDDLSKLENGIGEKACMFINFQVVFITSLFVAFMNDWKLALICLTFVPAAMIVLWLIILLTLELSKEELNAYSSAGSIAKETFTSIRTVVAFGGENKEIQRYKENLQLAKNSNIKRSRFTAIGIGLFWLIVYAHYALAFWYGVKLVLRHRDGSHPRFTVENMVTIIFSLMTGIMNFGLALTYIEAFGMSQATGNKLFEVIDHSPVINLSKGQGETIPNLKGNIKLKNVHFNYPSREEVPILSGLDFEINSGETVALVGASGCGKSTIIRLIQRFYDPTDGEIYLDGKDLKHLDLTWLRRQIGVVDQEPVLFGTTISENIKYGNQNATEDDIINAAKKANAHGFIRLFPNGYNTLVEERGAQLSGGQKQCIVIARALVRNPSILLLDEATSALDDISEAKVQAALNLASKDRTTVIVSHRLSTIREANKIVVISRGRVVEQGTHDELLALEKEYFNLVSTQVQSNEFAEKPNEYSDTDFEDNSVEFLPITRQDAVLSKEEEDNNQGKRGLIEVIKMNSPEWPHILIACLGAIIMGCAMPVFAIPFGDILWTLALETEEEVRSKSNRFAIYFVVAGVVAGLASFFQVYMFGIASEKLARRVRSEMFEAMLKQEIGYFDKKSNDVGALCAKLSGDASKGATGQCIGTVLQSITTLSLSIGLSMYCEWRLGLLALAFTPFIIVATFFEIRNARRLNDRRNESLQQSTRIAVEGVGNIRTVASLGCEETFYHNYIAELNLHYKKTLRSTRWRSLALSLSRSLIFLSHSACILYGGYLIKDGAPYQNLFTFSQALIIGTGSIANALAFTPNFTRGIYAARRVQGLLSRTPQIMDTASSINKDTTKGNLVYSNIHFSYPTRSAVPVLKGLDLTVLRRKTVALVGPSGCGKSTILRLAERFYDPNSGEVFLDEDEIKTLKLKSLRSHLGLVSQDPNLFNKTIAENIAYGDNSRQVGLSEIIEAARNVQIHNFVSSLPMGYETRLGVNGTQLSGGEKQKIAIARVLIRNPKILLLDEATSTLDPESEKVVQEALDKAKKGRTCIVIAHRLTTIQDADVICVINNGIIAEMGTHAELLMMNGLYYKLHSSQYEHNLMQFILKHLHK